MSVKQRERNCSLDMFRLLCAIFVCMEHIGPFENTTGLVWYYLNIVLTKADVPFFFCISGYYFCISLQQGQPVFIKTMAMNLLVYIIWSIFYFAYRYITTDIGMVQFLKECVYKFFIIGSTGHFWFFPAIFCCYILATVAFRFRLLKVLAITSIASYII